MDYTSFDNFIKRETGGSVRTEYHLAIDMAKELSMVERNEQGRKARQYFLECERRALNPVPLSLHCGIQLTSTLGTNRFLTLPLLGQRGPSQ